MRVKYSLIGIVFLFAVGILANSGYARIDPEAAIGIWLFDEGKGNIAEDSSGNGHDGTIMGAPGWSEGKFGDAMEFAGGESIAVPDHESLNFGTDSFSVVMWFNFSAPQDWNRLVRERDPNPWGSGNYGWEIQTEGLQIHWSLDDAKGNHQRATYPNVGDGEWHHTAMVVDREKTLLIAYMDGGNERTVNIANIESVTGTLPVTFGGGYAGAIDDVGIFKGVLSQDDIVDIMNLGLSEALKAGAAASPLARCTTTWAWVKNTE
jgi:hypothetical protein